MTAALREARLTLRPETKLWGSAAVVATWVGLPVIAAIYVIAIPAGVGGVILAGQIIAMIVLAAAIDRLRIAAITISDDGLRERGYLGRWRLSPTAKMQSVLLLDVLDAQTNVTSRQLFVLSHSGKTLLRLRGEIWSNRSMQQVIRALDLPVKVSEQPLTLRELRRDYGTNLYVFERRPRLTTIVCCVASVALLSPLYLAFQELTKLH
jgi:hypothetical protein